MEKKIKVTENGPYEVSGSIPLDKLEIETEDKGYPLKYKKIKDYSNQEFYQLCRCGHSSAKPFCDNTHKVIKFIGKENALTNKYLERADEVQGNDLILTDDFSLCSQAGFCRGKEGETWDLIKSKNQKNNVPPPLKSGVCDRHLFLGCALKLSEVLGATKSSERF